MLEEQLEVLLINVFGSQATSLMPGKCDGVAPAKEATSG